MYDLAILLGMKFFILFYKFYFHSCFCRVFGGGERDCQKITSKYYSRNVNLWILVGIVQVRRSAVKL